MRLIACLLLALPLAAARPRPVEIDIQSKVLGERRQVLVSLPPSFTSDARYPVLVLPDAELHLEHTAASADALAAVERAPELIIVAIPNTNRRRDLSPEGAGKFADFLESEVLPAVEKRYRLQPYRILAGHSLGGLFALETLFARPQLFDAWIVVSPSTFVEGSLAQRAPAELATTEALFLMSADEDPRIVEGVRALNDVLAKRRGVELRRFELPEEDHLTAPISGYYTGLRALFRSWFFRIDDSDDPRTLYPRALEHYAALKRRFGWDVPIPAGRYERIARRLLDAGATDEAMRVLTDFAKAYPSSSAARELLRDARGRHEPH